MAGCTGHDPVVRVDDVEGAGVSWKVCGGAVGVLCVRFLWEAYHEAVIVVVRVNVRYIMVGSADRVNVVGL